MSSTAILSLPLLPLDTWVVFPGMTVTLALETAEAKAALDAASGSGSKVVLVPRRPPAGVNQTGAGPAGLLAQVGTIAVVERAGTLPGGTPAAIVHGQGRARVGERTVSEHGQGASGDHGASWVSLEPITEPEASEASTQRTQELRALIDSLLEQRGAGRVRELVRAAEDPGALADTAGYWTDLSFDRKIELLETVEVDRRVQLVIDWAREGLAEAELRDRIRSDVAEGMERTQREFLLRQQLAAIRKELSELGDAGSVAQDYRQRLVSLSLPEAVRTSVNKEIDRLEAANEQSPEQGWIRAWLDTVFELPWGKRSADRLEVGDARAVLDADHTGLEDVKERIVEHLAVRKLRAERGLDRSDDAGSPSGQEPREDSPSEAAVEQDSRGSGMILTLVGPPGVGKTSLGESVARAMGRRFVRVSLGGVRDEAEIRGHRRTYVGALPGRIVRAIAEAGTMNPVVLLDEVDKLGADWRGDPSSALLEVLDPAQNHTFRDHYLDMDLDLSDVLFLATANMVEQVPSALLDRMEIVAIDGYTEDEKVVIGRDHLWPRQLRRSGLRAEEITVTDAALRTVVCDYTREAGVRGLERQLAKLLRKAAARVATGSDRLPLVVDGPDLAEWLGRPRFTSEVAERTSVPGVATGLAVTGAGGDVLFVEASAAPGEAGLTMTGQLGDVMRESAQISLSYVQSHAGELGIEPDAFVNRRIHVHVPAGAVPKDGPSAGVTMTSALVSLLTRRPVRSSVGMTGEITLQGKVLPIGGVKQKVLAAHRAGLDEVILPARNEPDLQDVPQAVRAAMTFQLAGDIGQVLEHALEAPTTP